MKLLVLHLSVLKQSIKNYARILSYYCQNMVLSPSKYLKLIVANTQQVSTQEKLYAENIITLVKKRTCFMSKVM